MSERTASSLHVLELSLRDACLEQCLVTLFLYRLKFAAEKIFIILSFTKICKVAFHHSKGTMYYYNLESLHSVFSLMHKE